MSDALLGVIVGGLFTGFGTWLTLLLQHRKWKVEKRIEVLNNKRKRLEERIDSAYHILKSSVEANVFNIGLVADIGVVLPEDAKNVFLEYIEKEDKTDSDKKHVLLKFSIAMKKSWRNTIKKLMICLNRYITRSKTHTHCVHSDRLEPACFKGAMHIRRNR